MDYSGYSTINTQRFGQQFVGKVANPHDMILWHKAPARRAKVCTPLIILIFIIILQPLDMPGKSYCETRL